MNAALWPSLELRGGGGRALADDSSFQSEGAMEVLGPQAQILKNKTASVFALTK